MSPSESYPERMTYELLGSGAVGDAAAAARGFGDAHQLASEDVARLVIVVEELVANLYEHGGQSDEERVELSLAREPAAIRIAITDSAHPFDPRTGPSNSLPAERGGGAGIDLVRAWAEIIRYDAEDGRNLIELRLPLRA